VSDEQAEPLAPADPDVIRRRLIVVVGVLGVMLLVLGAVLLVGGGGGSDGSAASDTVAAYETTTTEAETTTTEEAVATTERTTTTAEVTTTTERATTTAAPPTTEPQEPVADDAPPPRDAGSQLPAPVGTGSSAAWWSPGDSQYDVSTLWMFDPLSEARPYGWQQGYIPTGVSVTAGSRFSFVYSGGTESITLSYPSGTVQTLAIVDYDPDNDSLQVVWDGSVQNWYGCSSGQMPALALAACR